MPVRVFISYASVDNKPDPGVKDGLGWVDLLRERLKQRLPSYAGGEGEVCIDMDKEEGRISLHEPLADQFNGMVKATDVFIAVASPGYFKSKWCRKEFAAFQPKVKSGTGCLIKLQLFKDCGAVPADWEDHRVVRFFTPLGSPFAESVAALADCDPYQKAMTELLNKAGSLVKDLVERRPQASGEAAMAPASRVYLAEAEDTLEDDLNRVRAGLAERGIVTVEGNDWGSGEEHENRLREVLNRPNMVYVQLLSPKPVQRLREKIRRQYAIAKEVPALARMVWRDPAKVCDPAADEEHKDMWEGAIRDKTIEGFIVDVGNRVKEGRSGNAPVNEVPNVFIHGHESDAGTIAKISSDIDGSSCAKAIRPPAEAGINPLTVLLKQVRPCDGLLVLDGQGPPAWVKTQVMLCVKEMMSRGQKVPVWGLLMLPPQEKPEPEILSKARKSKRFVPIDCRTGYDPDKLELFTVVLEEE